MNFCSGLARWLKWMPVEEVMSTSWGTFCARTAPGSMEKSAASLVVGFIGKGSVGAEGVVDAAELLAGGFETLVLGDLAFCVFGVVEPAVKGGETEVGKEVGGIRLDDGEEQGECGFGLIGFDELMREADGRVGAVGLEGQGLPVAGHGGGVVGGSSGEIAEAGESLVVARVVGEGGLVLAEGLGFELG